MPPVDRLLRDKHVSLGEMGLRAVPLLKDFDRVPHVAVGKVYSEVGSVNRPPLTPLHGEVNCSIRPQE